MLPKSNKRKARENSDGERRRKMNPERIEFINKTIRILNAIEGKLTDGRDVLGYIRETRKKLEDKINKEKGEGK